MIVTTLTDRIREYASRKMHTEDEFFDPLDYGSLDSFVFGTDDGWTECARALLKEFDNTTTN